MTKISIKKPAIVPYTYCITYNGMTSNYVINLVLVERCIDHQSSAVAGSLVISPIPEGSAVTEDGICFWIGVFIGGIAIIRTRCFINIRNRKIQPVYYWRYST